MMISSEESSKTMIELAGKLTDFSTEVFRVISLVKGMADQINLMTLSSAIEAGYA